MEGAPGGPCQTYGLGTGALEVARLELWTVPRRFGTLGIGGAEVAALLCCGRTLHANVPRLEIRVVREFAGSQGAPAAVRMPAREWWWEAQRHEQRSAAHSELCGTRAGRTVFARAATHFTTWEPWVRRSTSASVLVVVWPSTFATCRVQTLQHP